MAGIKASQWSQAADNGKAAILAIGTANPPNIIQQSSFPDFYFRVTNSEHMIEFKEKFRRICDRSKVTKRHFVWDEALLKRHPGLLTYDSPSFNARQDITVGEIPRLGMAAAEQAIEEWGQPKSRITHLIFVTSSGLNLPGADFRLLQLLALPLTVNRFMLYMQACFAGATALRLAKDVAENNPGSRVLVVCAESTGFNFRGPSITDVHSLVSMALFGDGAAAVIVGAKPETGERALFHIASASQAALPESENAVEGPIRETGMMSRITKDVPGIIAKNIERILEKVFQEFGIRDCNSAFWVVHPGGPAVLDEVVKKLGLRKEKIRASMEILAEYGNLSSATVLFVLDWMRRRSEEEGKETTGEGLEWGVLLGFGPGITVETVVLRSATILGNSA